MLANGFNKSIYYRLTSHVTVDLSLKVIVNNQFH